MKKLLLVFALNYIIVLDLDIYTGAQAMRAYVFAALSLFRRSYSPVCLKDGKLLKHFCFSYYALVLILWISWTVISAHRTTGGEKNM